MFYETSEVVFCALFSHWIRHVTLLSNTLFVRVNVFAQQNKLCLGQWKNVYIKIFLSINYCMLSYDIFFFRYNSAIRNSFTFFTPISTVKLKMQVQISIWCFGHQVIFLIFWRGIEKVFKVLETTFLISRALWLVNNFLYKYHDIL